MKIQGLETAAGRYDSPGISTEYAFTARVEVDIPLTVDRAPDGVRRYIAITGGTVSGPYLNGSVLAVGGDSQMTRSDGVLVVEARYMIRTDDNILISVVNRGVRRASPAILAALMSGECVPREDYYFRTVPQFEAPLNSRYAELNNFLYIGTAEREQNAAVVHFYRVL